MEILARIFFALNSILLLILLVNYVIKNYIMYWWQELFGTIVVMFIIINIIVSFSSNKETKDTIEYKQGYQDALNTKFEQRIDTVYIKK